MMVIEGSTTTGEEIIVPSKTAPQDLDFYLTPGPAKGSVPRKNNYRQFIK